MCEENNELELEKKRNLGEVLCGERTEFERLQKNSDTTDWSILTTKILYSIKVIVQ